MVDKLALKTSGFSACAVFAMVLAAGCSSSSSSATSDGGAGDGSVATDGGDAGVPSICDKIPQADIQALLPATITSVTTVVGGGSNGGVGCSVSVGAGGIGLLIQTYPSDADKSKFNALLGDPTNPANHSISGIGDEAYYFDLTVDDAGTGVSSPNLVAHKTSGAAPSCGIESNDPPDTTMKTTSDGAGGFTDTQSDVIAYVQLMGKVCNDVFAASN